LNNLIFVPIGSYEQHGPHLPPNTDYLIAKRVTETVAQIFKGKITKGIKIGISIEHEGFKNTKSISPKVFLRKIKKILNHNQENAKFFLINAHGGNVKILKLVKKLKGDNILILNTFSLIRKDLLDIRTSSIGGICHAGEFETSIMLYLYPKKVKMHKLRKEYVKYVPSLDPNYEKVKLKNWKTINFNKYGILGDPYYATPEKGKLWFNSLVQKIKSSIEKFIYKK